MLLSGNNMCFELVYFFEYYIILVQNVREFVAVVIEECDNHCVRGDSLLLESVLLTSVHKLHKHQ